jgi:hypothetical protein
MSMNPQNRQQRLHRSTNKLTAGSGQFLQFPGVAKPTPALVSPVQFQSEFDPGAEIITEIFNAVVTKTFIPCRPENQSSIGYLGREFRISEVTETENSYTFKITNP